MRTLTDYLYMRDLPDIQCGIFRKKNEELQEATKFDLESSDHFPLMTRRIEDLPTSEGYLYRSRGVWVSPNLDHIMYRSSGEKKIFPVDQYQKVNVFATDRGNKFMDEVRNASKSLSPEYNMYEKRHLSIMHAYTGDSMGRINEKLTNGSRLSQEDRKNIMSLDEAVHAHSTPHAFTVWSGISPEHASKIIGSKQVRHPAYLSTSLTPHVAAAFARFKKDDNRDGGIEGHMLKIMIPHGHPGAFIGHINPTMDEHEFILPRGTILNIHHDKTLYAPIPHSDGKSLFTIHHATIEPQK